MNSQTLFDHVQGVAKRHLPEGDATQWELMLAEMKMNERVMEETGKVTAWTLWRTVVDKASLALRGWLGAHWGMVNAAECHHSCPRGPKGIDHSTFPEGINDFPTADGRYRRWRPCACKFVPQFTVMTPRTYFLVQWPGTIQGEVPNSITLEGMTWRMTTYL